MTIFVSFFLQPIYKFCNILCLSNTLICICFNWDQMAKLSCFSPYGRWTNFMPFLDLIENFWIFTLKPIVKTCNFLWDRFTNCDFFFSWWIDKFHKSFQHPTDEFLDSFLQLVKTCKHFFFFSSNKQTIFFSGGILTNFSMFPYNEKKWFILQKLIYFFNNFFHNSKQKC